MDLYVLSQKKLSTFIWTKNHVNMEIPTDSFIIIIAIINMLNFEKKTADVSKILTALALKSLFFFDTLNVSLVM